VHPVVPAAGGDRVDPAEDPVPDVGPAHLVDAGVDPVPPGVPDVLGDIGRVDVHLGRDAADVQAGAAEDAVLDQADVEMVEPVVDDRVAGAAADDDQVMMAHLGRLTRECCAVL
jgi:hypothetical protein